MRFDARPDASAVERPISMSIFISIAAYRDPQLAPTTADCLVKAQNPDGLRFGICWQHGPEEPRLQLFEDGRILDVHWRDSRGRAGRAQR
jgi:hypothetical protein